MLVKFPQSLFPLVSLTCSSGFKVLSTKKKLSNYSVEIHKDKNQEFLGPPEAPDHLPLATLPCLLEQCNHCGKSFVICYIIFKTRISFKEHMNRGVHLLATRPAGVEDRFVSKIMLLLDKVSVGGQKH